MAINYPQLKTEIQTDPQSRGYGPPLAAGNHTEVARLINLLSPGPTPPAVSVFRGQVATWEFFACIVRAEYDALTANEKQLLQTALSVAIMDTSDSGLRTLMASIFGAATATRAAMVARASRVGSRAEQLFGTGIIVTVADIALALAS